jgi:hypothetical protein
MVQDGHLVGERRVEVTVKLEQADYIRGYLWAYYLGVESRPMVTGLGLLLLLTLLGLNWLYHLNPIQARPPQLLGPIMAVAATACLPLYTYWRARSAFRRQWWLQQPTHYTFDRRGIASRAPSYSGFREWRRIWRVEENGRSFLIYLSQSQVVVIPKRFFASRDDILAFRELAAEHCARVSLSSS